MSVRDDRFNTLDELGWRAKGDRPRVGWTILGHGDARKDGVEVHLKDDGTVEVRGWLHPEKSYSGFNVITEGQHGGTNTHRVVASKFLEAMVFFTRVATRYFGK